MRRLIPLLLLSLLTLGAALGAALGLAYGSSSTTPSQWVAAVLAATEKAGSARLSYAQVSSSPNAELRSSLSGHGVVNFTTGDVRVIEVDHEVSFTSTGDQPLRPVRSGNTTKALVVDGTIYLADPIPSIAIASRYHELTFPRLPRSQRGLALALNASDALDSLRGSFEVASVNDLGPAEIDGHDTTQYEIGYAPLHVCAPHEEPQVLTQRPSQVWVDSAGRLVRVRSTSFSSGREPHGAKLPAALRAMPRGPVTTVAILTFSHFGTPVHVDAPPKRAIVPTGQSSVGMAISSGVCGS